MVKRNKHADLSQCPLACALDIIGDHWTLLIIRNLMLFGCHEYKDMLAMPEAISSNILSNRLKKLAKAGIIADAPHPDSKRRKLYYLTGKGKDLVHAILELARWANRHIGDRNCIPEAARPLFELPVDEAARIVLQNLAAWERQNLPQPPITPDERPL